jgi:hypothetical protein
MENMTIDELVALAVVSGVILPVIAISAFLHHRQERWKISLEHERRLRAIELGRTLPGDGHQESWLSPIRVGLMIGAGVPLGAFLSAMVTSLSVGFHDGVWVATSLVGLGAVISGSILAGRAYRESPNRSLEADAKPYVGEDAYDVVSARA